MKTNLKAILAAFLLTAAAIGVSAADLRNEDSKRYEVKVHDGGTTRNTWIDANTTIASICSSCEVEVVGVGRIRLSGSEKASIKNGKLIKQ